MNTITSEFQTYYYYKTNIKIPLNIRKKKSFKFSNVSNKRKHLRMLFTNKWVIY